MRRLTAIAVTLCAAGSLAACGDDESTSGSGAGSREDAFNETLVIRAEEPGDGQYAFDPDAVDAKVGTVRFELENPDDAQAPHNISIEGGGVSEASETIQPGNVTELDVELKAGTYAFFCSVGDHRAEGMEGELTVE